MHKYFHCQNFLSILSCFWTTLTIEWKIPKLLLTYNCAYMNILAFLLKTRTNMQGKSKKSIVAMKQMHRESIKQETNSQINEKDWKK